MAWIIRNILEGYNVVFNELRDPRTKNLSFTHPGTVVLVLSSYLFFCLVAGPRFMEKRKPYQLKSVLFIYNIFQIVYSMFLVVGGVYSLWKKNFNFWCEYMDFSESPGAILMIDMIWFYYFGKLTELLDTVFFVLRKKKNQLTFLHLYHHTSMVLLVWFGLSYFPGGHAYLFGVINSAVHVIMYTYYFLASLGPEYQKYIWWKRYITLMQLIQFLIIFVHNSIPIFSGCGDYKFINILTCVSSSIFIYMFGKFYIKSYTRNHCLKKEKCNGNDKIN